MERSWKGESGKSTKGKKHEASLMTELTELLYLATLPN